MAEQFANKAQTTLNGAIDSDDTSLVVTSATGFPTSGEFRIFLKAEGSNTDEICTVTAVSGTTFTVTRASEAIGGTQSASSHASGAEISHVLTAGAINSLIGTPQTFSPTFKAGSTTCTTSQLAAKYVQTGKTVWWRIDVTFSAGGTGIMSITDLPAILQWSPPTVASVVGGGLWANQGVAGNHVNVYAYSSTEWRFKKYNDYNDYNDTISNTDMFGLEGFLIIE